MASTRTYGMAHAKNVTPNNTVDASTAVTNPKAPGSSDPAGFIVAVSGDVEVVFEGGDDTQGIVLPAMAAGVIHACQFTHIRAAGTTATGIVAVFQ